MQRRAETPSVLLEQPQDQPQLCVLRHLGPETADQIISATSQQFFGLDKDSDGDSPIRIINLWACECDLLAQEVILAHSATSGLLLGLMGRVQSSSELGKHGRMTQGDDGSFFLSQVDQSMSKS